MVLFQKISGNPKNLWTRIRAYFKSLSSIYVQVVKVIAILSLFLFFSFGAIFRTINMKYMQDTIQQNGNDVCRFVEGALYQHMLENNKMALRSTLDIINTMPGVEDVNMYDAQDNLVYSSFPNETIGDHNPECKDCHSNISSMFPRTEKSFRIINMDSECDMSEKNHNYRLLLIKSPILNERSCYTSACHAHQESDEVLGSFVIRIPLEDLDTTVNSTSRTFFI